MNFTLKNVISLEGQVLIIQLWCDEFFWSDVTVLSYTENSVLSNRESTYSVLTNPHIDKSGGLCLRNMELQLIQCFNGILSINN